MNPVARGREAILPYESNSWQVHLLIRTHVLARTHTLLLNKSDSHQPRLALLVAMETRAHLGSEESNSQDSGSFLTRQLAVQKVLLWS